MFCMKGTWVCMKQELDFAWSKKGHLQKGFVFFLFGPNVAFGGEEEFFLYGPIRPTPTRSDFRHTVGAECGVLDFLVIGFYHHKF